MSTYVPPSGDPTEAKYVFIGEQPGQKEVEGGEPFIGPSGKNFDDCLYAAGIDRKSTYLTNVVKDLDWPLNYYIEAKSSKKGTKNSVKVSPKGERYIKMLKEELSYTTANVLIPMGNVALYALTNRVGIMSWRGSVLDSTLLPGRKVIPTIHPASYTWEKLKKAPGLYLNRYLIGFDFQKAKENVEFPEIRETQFMKVIAPRFGYVKEWLGKFREAGTEKGLTIYWDIELTPGSQELSCISFAGGKFAMCIPFVWEKGDYWTPDEELSIMVDIGKILEDERIRKAGQNVIFDSHFLLRKYGIRTRNLEDTMVTQQILYPEFPKDLGFITTMWTDIPYYKADGKFWLDGVGSFEKGWQYNCLDSLACAQAFPKQLEKIEEKGNMGTYERQKALIEPLTYMMEHGIKIDTKGMFNAFAQCDVDRAELQEQLNQKVGRFLNIDSPKQVREYFYEEKRIPPYLDKKGDPTVDETALKRIKTTHGYEEADLILQMRGLGKLQGTYLDVNKVDADGRIRCSYNPVGTKFSRISSSGNIFGTGMNLMNMPHEILQFFLIDEGYVGYSFDMSQIEARIVAYVGNIGDMIEVFENDRDIHRLTGSFMFHKHYDEISSIPGSCTYGNGKQSERDWAKRANHGFNYGYGYRKFALDNEVDETLARYIHNTYHSAYPGVRHSYWEGVKQQLREGRTLTNLYGRKTLLLAEWGEHLFNEAYSCIPQGTCGDHVNERGILYVYYSTDKEMSQVELLTQIHDSIDFQIPLTLPIESHARILLDMKRSLETPLSYRGREFVVPADLVVKRTLMKEGEVEALGTKTPPTFELKGTKAPQTMEGMVKVLEEAWRKVGYTK